MLWQKLPYEALMPKVVISAFPKAGLHLGVRMLSPMVQPQPPQGVCGDEWVGTFAHHAWTTQWIDSRSVCFRLGRVQAGRYVKGHLGWKNEIEEYLYYAGVGHVFVYRDLRDVAVSQAHHILAENERQFQHEGKALFRQMYDLATEGTEVGEGFERVLCAVIEGLGPWAGVVERWRLYAPWLESEWTLQVPFREMVEKPEAAAERMLVYLMGRAAGAFGLEVRIDEGEARAMVERMVQAAGERHLSPTYRRGEVGTWREVWTERVGEAWARVGGDEVLSEGQRGIGDE